jgi:hypothetical protein
MMNLVENVYEISEELLFTEPMNVMLNETAIIKLARAMKSEGIIPFEIPKPEDKNLGVTIELVASSINYCYWYGSSSVRPNQASSGSMYHEVEKAFKNYKATEYFAFGECIATLIKNLSIARFPLLEERNGHLKELVNKDAPSFVRLVCDSKGQDFDMLFQNLIELFQGFASDIFLKRASLFFLQLFRKYSWFQQNMKTLHVPADYQVPKILKHFNCFYYKDDLTDKIKNSVLIPKYSLEECQIRAATVTSCKMLQEETGWNIADIDGWLWLRRKTATEPFHLTITTDY